MFSAATIFLADDGLAAARKLVGAGNIWTLHEAYARHRAQAETNAPLPTLSAILQNFDGSARVALLVGFGWTAAVATSVIGCTGPLAIIASVAYVGAVDNAPWHRLGAIVGFAAMTTTALQLGILRAHAACIAAVAITILYSLLVYGGTGQTARVEIIAVTSVSLLLVVA